MRLRLFLSSAVAAAALVACTFDFDLGPMFCGMEGPCDSVAGFVAPWITGLPFERASISDAGWEDLVQGDSVALYLVSGDNPSNPRDTVRAVTWAVTDSAVARIAPGLGGSGVLVARAPGSFNITANGGVPPMFACGPSGCARINLLRVIAPPTPNVR